MPSNFTENYQLSQWEATDQVKREDFNADNAKIDAAIAAAAFGGHVEYGTYVGNGRYGNSEGAATVLQLGYQPKLLIVGSSSNQGMAIFLQNCPSSAYLYGIGTLYLAVHWLEDGLSWNPTNGRNGPEDQLNGSDIVYHYVAFR